MKSQFFKSSSWSFSAVVVRAFGALAVNKIFAAYLGTAGITLLAHFQNLMSLFTQLPAEGVNRCIMKHWSDPKLSDRAKIKVFQSGFWLTNLLLLLLFAFYYWKKDYFFARFIGDYSERQFLGFFLAGITLLLLSHLFNAVILARRDVKAFALISFWGSAIVLTCSLIGVMYGSMDEAILGYVSGYGFIFLGSLTYFIIKRKTLKIGFGKPDGDSMKKLGSFLLMAISSIIFGKLLDFVVRDYIIDLYGEDRTGLWQSVVKMSSSYILVFTGTIGVVYYPKMASLIHEPGKLRAYVLKVMGFVAFVSIICLGVYYFNRNFFLQLFFDQGFERAGYLVKYQASGDLFALVSYLLAYLLSARVQTWRYIFSQALSAGVYVMLIMILLNQLNLEALTVAYMWRHISFFIILIIFNRRLLFRWNPG